MRPCPAVTDREHVAAERGPRAAGAALPGSPVPSICPEQIPGSAPDTATKFGNCHALAYDSA